MMNNDSGSAGAGSIGGFADLARVQARATAAAEMSSQMPRLGTLFWWRLAGNACSHAELVACARAEGLADKFLPRGMTPLKSFRRAWRATVCPENLALEEVGDTPDELVLGVLRTDPDVAHRDLRPDTAASIVFNKKTSARYLELPGTGPIDLLSLPADVQQLISALNASYQRHTLITTADVRGVLSKWLRVYGVNVHKEEEAVGDAAGGVWFVPRMYDAEFEAISSFLTKVGRNVVSPIPIWDEPAGRSRAAIGSAAQATLSDEIARLEKEISGWDWDTKKDSTIAERLDRFRDLRARAGLFSGILTFKADSLMTRLNALHQTVAQHVAEAVAADPQAPLPLPEPLPAPPIAEPRPSTPPPAPPAHPVEIDPEAGF